MTRNPFNANQLTKIRLDADMADAIVLWTKNPAPMLDRLDELDACGGGRKACGGRRVAEGGRSSRPAGRGLPWLGGCLALAA